MTSAAPAAAVHCCRCTTSAPHRQRPAVCSYLLRSCWPWSAPASRALPDLWPCGPVRRSIALCFRFSVYVVRSWLSSPPC